MCVCVVVEFEISTNFSIFNMIAIYEIKKNYNFKGENLCDDGDICYIYLFFFSCFS
jgi:hypothetical protein